MSFLTFLLSSVFEGILFGIALLVMGGITYYMNGKRIRKRKSRDSYADFVKYGDIDNTKPMFDPKTVATTSDMAIRDRIYTVNRFTRITDKDIVAFVGIPVSKLTEETIHNAINILSKKNNQANLSEKSIYLGKISIKLLCKNIGLSYSTLTKYFAGDSISKPMEARINTFIENNRQGCLLLG